MQAGKAIGVTGHQARDGLDWLWTRAELASLFREFSPVGRALTSLAVGTDQVFAEEALDQGIDITAVIPFDGYERCFEGPGLASYRRLLACCAHTVVLDRTGTDEQAFLAAGIHVADACDLLVAVWDGKPSAGLGGTGDVVAHALASGRETVHMNPILRTVVRLAP